MLAPVNWETLTSKGAIFTETWSMASKDIGCAFPPGRGLLLKPKLLLKAAPSTVIVLKRPSLPTKELPWAWGVNFEKSVMLREIEGSVFMSPLLMLVCAPVLSELKIGFPIPAETTTSSRDVVDSFNFTFCRYDSPRLRLMSV